MISDVVCIHQVLLIECPKEHDFGMEAQATAEDHLMRCWEAMDREENGTGDAWEDLDIAAPFCGCDTCQVREVLHAAWPVFELWSHQS